MATLDNDAPTIFAGRPPGSASGRRPRSRDDAGAVTAPPGAPRQRAGRRLWSPLRDVDPRIGEHLLDLLHAVGIAAYLEPSADVGPYTRTVFLPSPPTDRLFVDRAPPARGAHARRAAGRPRGRRPAAGAVPERAGRRRDVGGPRRGRRVGARSCRRSRPSTAEHRRGGAEEPARPRRRRTSRRSSTGPTSTTSPRRPRRCPFPRRRRSTRCCSCSPASLWSGRPGRSTFADSGWCSASRASPAASAMLVSAHARPDPATTVTTAPSSRFAA